MTIQWQVILAIAKPLTSSAGLGIGRVLRGWSNNTSDPVQYVHIPRQTGTNRCRRDKNSVSSPPLEPCFDVPNNSPNHLLNSLLLCLEKLTKKSSNQTTHLFSCQNLL